MSNAGHRSLSDNQDIAKAEIRELVENWAIYRDALDWKRFANLWHPDGRMMATWWQGPFHEFIKVSREGFDRGVRILHFLGATSVDVMESRAIAQTKMTITQRAIVGDVLCDVVCTGRFYDFLERYDGRWLLVLRQPIYERDRLDPVVPGETPEIDRAILESFPEGYRHLAYLQQEIGYPIKTDMPGLIGPSTEQLYADGATWLAGDPLSR